jgi:hypothetical protein
MEEAIINRVAKSGIETIDLGDFFPEQEMVEFDIKDWLFHGLILKEKDFRQALEEHDWTAYQDKLVAIHCSNDAIVPVWAYMLLAMKLQPYAGRVVYGNRENLLNLYYQEVFSRLRPEDYSGKRMVIKGCGDKPVPVQAYSEITRLLMPYVKSIMYGEPCSTVPVYKQPK